MSRQGVRIIDNAGDLVASATVIDEGSHFGGEVDLGSIPGALMALFREFEGAVNDQTFGVADEIQVRLARVGLRAVLGDAPAVCVDDLQVYPSTGDISFKLPCPPALADAGRSVAAGVEQ